MMKDFEEIIGIEYLKAVHLNDSHGLHLFYYLRLNSTILIFFRGMWFSPRSSCKYR